MRYHSLIAITFLLLSSPANAPGTINFPISYNSNSYRFETIAKKDIELKSFWTVPPNILICDRVVPVSRVRKALKFWERLGYEFGEITESDDLTQCSADHHNSIRIMLPDNTRDMSNELAITLTDRIVATDEAISADIIIHSFATHTELVLEHEIGHALGWQHINLPGHVMYPEYRLVGHDTSYIDYVRYVKIMHQKFIKE